MYNLGIVVPTYNEKDNIINLIDQLSSNLKDKSINTILLIMDDSSPDGTGEIVRDYINNHNFDFLTIELKVRAGKQGLASAYTQGFQYLIDNYSPSYLLSLDADLSHDPKYIPLMYNLIDKENQDLIVGSRYVDGGGVLNWGIFRKMISKGGSLYAKTILGININDLTGGFNMYRSSLFDTIELSSINAHGYLFQIEMKYRVSKITNNYKEFPIIFADRVNGKSKMSKLIILEAFLGVWKLKFYSL
jgi:dolichol-phosphate mannosyltransferase